FLIGRRGGHFDRGQIRQFLHDLSLLASGPPAGSFRYTASRLLHRRPVPPRLLLLIHPMKRDGNDMVSQTAHLNELGVAGLDFIDDHDVAPYTAPPGNVIT